MDGSGESFGCFLILFNICLFLFFGASIYDNIGIIVFPWIVARGGALGVLLTSTRWLSLLLTSTGFILSITSTWLLLDYGLCSAYVITAHINYTTIT